MLPILDGVLLCPLCANAYVHLEGAAMTSLMGTDKRRVIIEGSCEGDTHWFIISLQFHKGNTYVDVQKIDAPE